MSIILSHSNRTVNHYNGQSLEEFYGHLTNYCKVKKVKREQVNLYVITNHFPKNLLEPLLKTGQVVAQHKGGTKYPSISKQVSSTAKKALKNTEKHLLGYLATMSMR